MAGSEKSCLLRCSIFFADKKILKSEIVVQLSAVLQICTHSRDPRLNRFVFIRVHSWLKIYRSGVFFAPWRVNHSLLSLFASQIISKARFKNILFWFRGEPASPISCGNYLYASLQGVVKNIPFWWMVKK